MTTQTPTKRVRTGWLAGVAAGAAPRCYDCLHRLHACRALGAECADRDERFVRRRVRSGESRRREHHRHADRGAADRRRLPLQRAAGRRARRPRRPRRSSGSARAVLRPLLRHAAAGSAAAPRAGSGLGLLDRSGRLHRDQQSRHRPRDQDRRDDERRPQARRDARRARSEDGPRSDQGRRHRTCRTSRSPIPTRRASAIGCSRSAIRSASAARRRRASSRPAAGTSRTARTTTTCRSTRRSTSATRAVRCSTSRAR